MGLEADSFDKRSLSSLHSQQSIQNLRLQALKKSLSHDVDGSFNRSGSLQPIEDSSHVW